MKKLSLIALSLFVLGCGGGGSSEDGKDTIVLKSKIADPSYEYQWYLHRNDTFYSANNINYNAHIHPKDYFRKYRGKGIKIAIIDNSLDISHYDLAGAIKGTYSVLTKSSSLVNPYNIDVLDEQDRSHGTNVTGVVGARANDDEIYSIASESSLYFLQYSENMSELETIELFKKAKEFGADIINCSWGTYDVSESVKEYIQDLATNGRDGKGVLVVFPTGNGDEQNIGIDVSDINDESMIKEVISVGASDTRNQKASYSNYGQNLDVLAPGGDFDSELEKDILTLGLDNSSMYNSGTSFSAPIVSATLALMLEVNPNLTRVQAEDILKSTADKIGNFSYENGRNNFYGYGKINLSKALKKSLDLR